ncbi:MAG: hypothetical protein LBE82_02105, partial [Chitinophagaceae bacterium]|nr:hypothetical protein [Chitinophagaceae bacterium]
QNQITALDITKNTTLTRFSCGGNRLATLDISNNRALEELNCWGNLFTSLDISNNTALIWLGCEENAITNNMDFTKNINLESLRCSKNQFGKTTSPYVMNLRNCTKLTTLSCSDNPYISEVQVLKMPNDLDNGEVKIVVNGK